MASSRSGVLVLPTTIRVEAAARQLPPHRAFAWQTCPAALTTFPCYDVPTEACRRHTDVRPDHFRPPDHGRPRLHSWHADSGVRYRLAGSAWRDCHGDPR